MATNNAINLKSAGIAIYDGAGTFTATTTTQHDLLIGGTSNTITNVAPSATSGVPVISQGAAADPTFGTAAIAGGGTNATSFTQSNGIVAYNGTSLVNYAGPQLSSGGIYTNTSQPAFSAYLATSLPNLTGDNTTVTVIFDSTTVNQGTNYSTSTGIFTAPVAGNYYFSCCLCPDTTDTGASADNVRLVTTATTYKFPAGIQPAGGSTFPMFSILVHMSANDTAKITWVIAGITKTIGLFGTSSTTSTQTFFTGVLIC